LRFRFYSLRFTFQARDRVRFPAGTAANYLRGAFGAALHGDAALYARLFDPAAVAPGPSGLADSPRPFVFRTRVLEGRSFVPGEIFFFDLHLFDMRDPPFARLSEIFAQLAGVGFGPGRGRADLTEAAEPVPVELSLEPLAERVERAVVRFLTPVELKSGRGLLERPEFAALASRIRDRLSTLRALYDDGPLAIDFRGFGERAARVRMTRCEIERVETYRRSHHTGQTHPLGGFTGEAEYAGDLSEFIPYLRAAQWTGVGRQTVWGKGEIEVSVYS
jgi:hypothetical protein